MRALQGLGQEGKKSIEGIMEIQFEVSVFFFLYKKKKKKRKPSN